MGEGLDTMSLFEIAQWIYGHLPQIIAFVGVILVEKSKAIKFSPISLVGRIIGDWLTTGVKDWVVKTNGAMEKRLEEKITSVEKQIDERIDDVKETVEQYREEGVQRDLIAKADFYHDDILLQADKMRGGKIPNSERGAQLYRKVKWYEKFTKEHPEYENGVCDLACEYIKNWFKKNYGELKEDNKDE